MAVPGSSGAVLARTDLTFKVGEEEAGGGEGGVGEVVVGVVLALRHLPASLPALRLLGVQMRQRLGMYCGRLFSSKRQKDKNKRHKRHKISKLKI